MRNLVLACLLAASLSGAAGPVTAAEAAGPEILPHRAVYSLQLVESRDGGTIIGAKGRIEFEWSAGCDGWTVNQKTLLILADSEGNNFDTGWTLKAWESNDGLTYRFAVKRLGSGAPSSLTRGRAQLEVGEESGLVTFSEPDGRAPMSLPAGTRFPTRHSRELLQAAVDEELLIWRQVFDGTNDGGLFGVNAVITGALPPGAGKPSPYQSLQDLRSWQLEMAFFETEATGPDPEHQQVLRLYANGVVDELRFDYGDFVLAGGLERLEMLAHPKCE